MTTKWPTRSLAEVLRDASVFTDGDWVESKDQDPNGDVRLVQLADIGDGEYAQRSSRFLTQEKAQELRCTFLEPGDVLVARMPDPLGRACIFPGDAMPSVTVVDVCVIRVDDSTVDRRWLKHSLNSEPCRLAIRRHASGTTRSRISRGNLAKVELPLPPIEEQRRIAAILDKADELRRTRARTADLLPHLRDSLFDERFSGNHIEIGNVRVSQLEEVAKIVDCPHSTPHWEPTGVICLRTPNLAHGSWNWSDTRFVSEATFRDRTRRARLEAGDIVLSREGTVGIGAIVEEGMRGCMGQRLVQVRPDQAVIDPVFLLNVLLKLLDPARISHVLKGSTAKHLDVRELRQLRVPVPDMALQRAFVDRCIEIARLEAEANSSTMHLRSLFASLQHRALRGEL